MLKRDFFTLPRALKPGDTVAVVAPGSAANRAKLDAGIEILRQRYQVRVSGCIYDAQGYLAGSDERRARELVQAMLDPDVRAIFAARGGYGTTRIEDDLPWDVFRRSPKWIVGFSDITALHIEASRRRIASLHAPMVAQLSDLPAERRQEIFSMLEAPQTPIHFAGLEAVVRGRVPVSGVLVGGNVSLLHAMAAAGRLEVPQGCILALEDDSEAPYRVDRMLTSLRVGGYLARVAGIVLGSFTNCEPREDGVTVYQAIASCVLDPRIGIYKGAPFGHEAGGNRPFVLGTSVTLRDGEMVSHQQCDLTCCISRLYEVADQLS